MKLIAAFELDPFSRFWSPNTVCFFDRLSSGELRLGGQEHFYMETQSMLVVPVGEERELNVYISSQWPTLVQVRREETNFTDGGGARLNSLLSKIRKWWQRRWTSRPTGSPVTLSGLAEPSGGR